MDQQQRDEFMTKVSELLNDNSGNKITSALATGIFAIIKADLEQVCPLQQPESQEVLSDEAIESITVSK